MTEDLTRYFSSDEKAPTTPYTNIIEYLRDALGLHSTDSSRDAYLNHLSKEDALSLLLAEGYKPKFVRLFIKEIYGVDFMQGTLDEDELTIERLRSLPFGTRISIFRIDTDNKIDLSQSSLGVIIRSGIAYSKGGFDTFDHLEQEYVEGCVHFYLAAFDEVDTNV